MVALIEENSTIIAQYVFVHLVIFDSDYEEKVLLMICTTKNLFKLKRTCLLKIEVSLSLYILNILKCLAFCQQNDN